MGICCALFLLSSSPRPPVPPSPRLPLSSSLSFLSVNIEFLRVTLDRSARFARKREDVVAAIVGRQFDLFEQFNDRRVRTHPHVFGFKLDDGEAGGGQRHPDLVWGVFAVVLINRRFSIVLG